MDLEFPTGSYALAGLKQNKDCIHARRYLTSHKFPHQSHENYGEALETQILKPNPHGDLDSKDLRGARNVFGFVFAPQGIVTHPGPEPWQSESQSVPSSQPGSPQEGKKPQLVLHSPFPPAQGGFKREAGGTLGGGGQIIGQNTPSAGLQYQHSRPTHLGPWSPGDLTCTHRP